MCRYLHGTSADRLDSIKQHGLLGPDEVERLGFTATYPGLSWPGHVYLIDGTQNYEHCPVESNDLPTYSFSLARAWGRRGRFGDEVVLCVDPVDAPKNDSNMPSGTACRQHAGAIPPERIRIHQPDGVCAPLAA